MLLLTISFPSIQSLKFLLLLPPKPVKFEVSLPTIPQNTNADGGNILQILSEPQILIILFRVISGDGEKVPEAWGQREYVRILRSVIIRCVFPDIAGEGTEYRAAFLVVRLLVTDQEKQGHLEICDRINDLLEGEAIQDVGV